MDVSIIIISYNVEEYIISCIQSIYKHSKSSISFEIQVVDNNSSDNTIDRIKTEFPNVLISNNLNNIGFPKAVNQAAKKSKGKYLFILNPDTCFTEDSLYELFANSEKIINFGAIGPMLISKNGHIQQSYWRFPSLMNTFLSLFYLDFLNFFKNYKDDGIKKTVKVDSISGGAFFINRKNFNNLNGFNEELFWMEDIDICLRLSLCGLQTHYLPQTKIIHFSGKSSEKNQRVAVFNQLNSKIKYFNLHHSKMATICLFFIIFML